MFLYLECYKNLLPKGVNFYWDSLYDTQHIKKDTSCQETWFWGTLYMGAKSKCPKIWTTRLIWDFMYFWNPQYLLSKVLEGFDIKTVFSCKKWILNCCCMVALCLDSQTLITSLFLKINFSMIVNDITISWEHNVPFQHFLHQNWAERIAI